MSLCFSSGIKHRYEGELPGSEAYWGLVEESKSLPPGRHLGQNTSAACVPASFMRYRAGEDSGRCGSFLTHKKMPSDVTVTEI